MSSPSLQIADTLLAASSATLRRAAEYLLSRRAGEGYWCGELTADTTLESDFILLELWRHPPQNGVWNPPTRGLIDKAVRSILARQLPDGGFSIYEKGPSEVSASIKAYVALKLAGLDTDRRPTSRACGSASWRWAACKRPTATSRSTSACSACIRASTRRRFLPS